MISQYKLDIIRQVMNKLNHNHETNEFSILGKYFKGYEEDQYLHFSNYSLAKEFIIETLLKDLN